MFVFKFVQNLDWKPEIIRAKHTLWSSKCWLQSWGKADTVCHVLGGYPSSGIEIGTLARQAKKRMANASRFYNSLPLLPTRSYILSWWCFRWGKMVRGWRVQKLCRSISFVVSNRSFQIQRYVELTYMQNHQQRVCHGLELSYIQIIYPKSMF